MSWKDYPMVDDLSDQDFETLSRIKTVKDLKKVEILDDWHDDHCPCVGVRINGVHVSFWWLTETAMAAFHYPDSRKAAQMIFEIVTDYVKNADRTSDDEAGEI